MSELVSIVMPAYNASLLIKKSITSVLEQTYENWELIIVNDCSKDNTYEICEEYTKKDSRIKLINLSENKGIYNARNVAIENSQGKYIAFLDSDDLWYSNKLASQVRFMQDNNIAFSYTAYDVIGMKGESYSKIFKVREEINYKDLLKVNVIGCLTVMVDKSKIIELKMPRVKHEDYATWLTLLRDNDIKAYGMKDILASYRKTVNSVSSNKLKTLGWTWKIFHDHLGYNALLSLCMLIRHSWNTIKKNM